MYETVIGLEVHVQLKTKTKVFCGCSTEFGSEPNSQVCPVCLGFPGVLPVLNKTAFDHALRTSLALSCTVQEFTKFDRKHYFYPDLPKNFQISQFDLPIGKDGFIDIDIEGTIKRIRIRRVHLEEDAGKLIHREDMSLVDFNRTGMPLLEIVTEPDIQSPSEAYEYLTTLKSIIEYLGVSDCDMEKGSLRCDANVSVRKQGHSDLGTKREVKNMNSFRGVRDALTYEAARQIELIQDGQTIVQETLLWDPKAGKTFAMRSKEEAKDYRYFPEPDLPPFIVSKEKLDAVRLAIPELPKEKKERFIQEYGLSDYDAKILVFSKKDADYAEECLKLFPDKNKKPITNWFTGALLAEANNRNKSLVDLNISSRDLIELVILVQKGDISNLSGKAVLADMIETGKPPAVIIKEKNLIQISDSGALDAAVNEVINTNAASVNDYKQGKTNAVMFLVGQVMKKTQGKANPKVVQELLKQKLS